MRSELDGLTRVKRRALDGGTLLKCSLHLNSHIVTIFYTIFSICEVQNDLRGKIFELTREKNIFPGDGRGLQVLNHTGGIGGYRGGQGHEEPQERAIAAESLALGGRLWGRAAGKGVCRAFMQDDAAVLVSRGEGPRGFGC